MFYRVVLQSRTAGDKDLATVKREFARVTGLSETVTETLFARAPNPIKEGITLEDAERVAATLRAIGATVTVERDLLASLDKLDGGAHEIQAPAHRGPPTVTPNQEPPPVPESPTRAQTLRKRLGRYLPYIAGIPMIAVAVVVLAPIAIDLYEGSQPSSPAPAPPKAAKAPPPDTPAAPVTFNATLLHGPWRCTDQRTGLSEYWTFGSDGALAFHGDTLKEESALPNDPSAPQRWRLDGNRLEFVFLKAPSIVYTVSNLSFARLWYGDGKDLQVQCRRP